MNFLRMFGGGNSSMIQQMMQNRRRNNRNNGIMWWSLILISIAASVFGMTRRGNQNGMMNQAMGFITNMFQNRSSQGIFPKNTPGNFAQFEFGKELTDMTDIINQDQQKK